MSAAQSTPPGDLPVEWKVKTLGEIIEKLESGISVNSDGDAPNFNNEHSILKTSAIFRGAFIPSESKRIVAADVKRAKLNPRADTIIISRMNTPALVGECGYVERDYPFLFVPDRLWMMKFKSDTDVSPKWLNYLLSSGKYRDEIKSTASGTSNSMKNISKSSLLALEIPFPPIAEQRAIADALSDIDAWIGAQEALIAKKRDLKTATMAQLLTGQIRLAGFNGDWQTKTLGEIGECVSGLTYSPSEVNANGLLVLRSSNVQKGRLDFEDTVYVNKVVQERIIVVENDILICVRNGSSELIGKCAMIGNNPKRMTFGAFMTVFRTPHAPFVFYQFQSDVIKKQIKEHLGATINQITNKSLNSFEIKLPPLDEQIAIAAILSGLDEELAALDAQLDKTRQLKAATMTALLSGAKCLV